MWHTRGMITPDELRTKTEAVPEATARAIRERDDAIVQAVRQGMSRTEIEGHTKLSRMQVNRICRSAGLPDGRTKAAQL